MDLFLLILGFLFAISGILGAILPILPGPILSWIGLLLLFLTSSIPVDYTFLGITLVITIFVTVVDYIIPAIGTKKFGGSNYCFTGTMVGLVLGIILFPPLGIVLGPFIGAFIGELIKDYSNPNQAFKAALGSFIGFLTSTLLKFVVAIIFTGLYFNIFWEHKNQFFNF